MCEVNSDIIETDAGSLGNSMSMVSGAIMISLCSVLLGGCAGDIDNAQIQENKIRSTLHQLEYNHEIYNAGQVYMYDNVYEIIDGPETNSQGRVTIKLHYNDQSAFVVYTVYGNEKKATLHRGGDLIKLTNDDKNIKLLYSIE